MVVGTDHNASEPISLVVEQLTNAINAFVEAPKPMDKSVYIACLWNQQKIITLKNTYNHNPYETTSAHRG